METNDRERALAQALIEAGGAFVSGAALAQQQSLSRVSIHSGIQRLGEAGFTIEAVRSRGYRLVTMPPHVHPLAVEILLARAGGVLNIHYRDETGSTNTEASRLLAEGAEAPLAVISRRQTAGRGRLGRTWASEDPGNLYLSLGLRPDEPPARMQRLTLWFGLSLCRELGEQTGIPLRI